VHWNVPHSSSPMFTGREEILQQMEQALFPETNVEAAESRRAFVLYGLGGSGKTQICLRFCEKHRERLVPSIPTFGGLQRRRFCGVPWMVPGEFLHVYEQKLRRNTAPEILELFCQLEFLGPGNSESPGTKNLLLNSSGTCALKAPNTGSTR
jgi:Cdc6-like AAA superfamily ATPase